MNSEGLYNICGTPKYLHYDLIIELKKIEDQENNLEENIKYKI